MTTDNIKRYQAVSEECANLYEEKNKLYGNSFEKTLDEWGLAISGARLEDKLNRAKILLREGKTSAGGESLRDTLIDLANYAIMSVAWLDKPKNL